MLKKQLFLCLILALGLLPVGHASAATLNFNPISLSVVETNSFDVDVILSDLGGGLVGGFDIVVGYDPLLLTATDVQYSGNLGIVDIDTFTSTDLSIPGEVTAFEFSFLPAGSIGDPPVPLSLGSLQDGASVTIATLRFLANGTGTASLSFLFSLISAGDALPIDLTAIGTARVVISPIPLPGAIWLMITGLMGVGAMARKKALTR